MTQLETIYRDALEKIIEGSPKAALGMEYAVSGGNYDDAYYGGADDEHFRLAEIAKAALSAQGEQGMDHPPKNLEEFKVRLFNDPVAYAYYNMGRAVEQDYRTDPDERASRNFEALYAVINEWWGKGFGKRILPDYWLTAEEPFPTPTAQEPPTETQERC